MRLGAGKAFKTRAENKSIRTFNNMWESGDTLRAIYPVFRDETGDLDLLAGAVWGHSWNCKISSLKKVFIPVLSELNEDGYPITKDIMDYFAKIAPMIVEGQKAEKVKKINSNTRMQPSVKESNLKEIDKEFENARPLCGKLDYKIFTECLAIKLDNKGQPIWDKSGVCSQDLSNKRYMAIKTAINTPGFVVEMIDDEFGFAEINYTFGTDPDKSKAGDITPIGVPAAGALMYKYSDEEADKNTPERVETYDKIVMMRSTIPDDSNTIIKRNPNVKPVPEYEVRQAIENYASSNYSALDALDGETDVEKLLNHIDIIRMFNIPMTMPKIVEELDRLDAEEEAGDAPTIDNVISENERREAIENASEGLNEDAENAGLINKKEDAKTPNKIDTSDLDDAPASTGATDSTADTAATNNTSTTTTDGNDLVINDEENAPV